MEVLGIHLVHGSEVRHVGEEDGGLNHIVERSAGLGEDGLDVLDRLAGLGLDVGGHLAVGGVDGKLTGYKDQVAGLYGLAIGADCAGGVGRFDFLFHGGMKIIYQFKVVSGSGSGVAASAT